MSRREGSGDKDRGRGIEMLLEPGGRKHVTDAGSRYGEVCFGANDKSVGIADICAKYLKVFMLS